MPAWIVQWYVYVPACSVGWYVPVVMVDEFAGKAAGPVSHVTLCELDALVHVNVTWPAGTVSGVGLKKLLLTVRLVVCPPVLLPVELLHAATAATLMATATAIPAKRITPPEFE
ncbi:MAG TPA: hypothetical protein VEZ49_06860 [Gemmatimonadales bacterium]|nr:hypothetical protein [Gemmatimonadales bacterium]